MINTDCSLILKDLYSYDVVAAYPTILSKQHYDFNGIDLDNKTERNIFIGKQQVGNENLSTFLLESIDSLVKYYLQENNVADEDVITIQRDGFIIKKMLENNDEFIGMKLREYIDFLILTPDRKKFLYLSDGKIVVKGMPYYYDELDKVYQMFSNLSFYNKSLLFEQMENIKKAILQNQNKKLFLIPKEETSFIVLTYKGDIEIKDPDMIALSSIDKMRYYNHFIRDFLQSIYLECY